MRTDNTQIPAQLAVVAWVDPVIDTLGFPPNHAYSEICATLISALRGCNALGAPESPTLMDRPGPVSIWLRATAPARERRSEGPSTGTVGAAGHYRRRLSGYVVKTADRGITCARAIISPTRVSRSSFRG